MHPVFITKEYRQLKADLPDYPWQSSAERSLWQPHDERSPGKDFVINGRDIWCTQYGLWSLLPGGSSFIRQETEPVSLSAISLKSAATPCQSWFRWFGILKRKQRSMTDMSLHINTHSQSKETHRQFAYTRATQPVVSTWLNLTGRSFIRALCELLRSLKDLRWVKPQRCAFPLGRTGLKNLSLTHERVGASVLVKEERGKSGAC